MKTAEQILAEIGQSNELLLADINLALSGILENMETKSHGELIDAIKGIEVRPQVNVHVEAQDAPVVTVHPPSVTVEAPNVNVVMPDAPSGWKITITGRDANGLVREMILKPEY
jgi:hypothetical protein